MYKIKGSVQYWPNLSEEFKVPRAEHENFSKGETFSPSERMFRYIEAAKPRLTIDQLQEAFLACHHEDMRNVLQQYIDGT